LSARRLDDDDVRSAFERRARGVPRRGLLSRILRAIRPLRPETVVLPFPGRAPRPPLLRRYAILVPIAPLVAAALVVYIGGQVGWFRATNLQSSPQSSGIVIVDDDADSEDAERVADDGRVAGAHASDVEDRADDDDDGEDDRDDD
jgi:hypothetical protein